MSTLKDKIKHSTEVLIKAARLAERYSEKPIFLAFSGGKDSQVCYHLLSGVGIPFEAYYSATTIDPPEVVRFIRTSYPEVKFITPKISFWKLCEKKRMLPTMRIRFCCSSLKEIHGEGRVVVTGVRRAESAKRAKRMEMSTKNKTGTSTDMTIDEFTRDKETQAECHMGQREKIVVNPILDWTEEDVWTYLNEIVKVPHCSVYDTGRERVGCLFCPMKSQKEIIRDAKEYPHQFKRLKQVILTITKKSTSYFFGNPQAYFEWWVSNRKIKTFKALESAKLFPADVIKGLEEIDLNF